MTIVTLVEENKKPYMIMNWKRLQVVGVIGWFISFLCEKLSNNEIIPLNTSIIFEWARGIFILLFFISTLYIYIKEKNDKT